MTIQKLPARAQRDISVRGNCTKVHKAWHLAARIQSRSLLAARKRGSPQLTALAVPRPWQERCGNSSESLAALLKKKKTARGKRSLTNRAAFCAHSRSRTSYGSHVKQQWAFILGNGKKLSPLWGGNDRYVKFYVHKLQVLKWKVKHGRIILKRELSKQSMGMFTGFLRHRQGFSCRLLCALSRTQRGEFIGYQTYSINLSRRTMII